MNLDEYQDYVNSGHIFIEKKPRNWDSIRVKDLILKVGSGVTPKGGSEVYLDSGIPLLRSQNVYDDGLRISDVSFIDEETDKKMRNSRIKPYDLLINITGASIGRTCVIPESLKRANINQHILYLRLKKKKVDFISYYFKSQFLKDYIMMIQAGSSKEALTMGQALNIPVICPSSTEQTQIANYLDKKTTAIDKKVELLEQKTRYYKELRKSLINETVCRGLNKDINLVDSGIDWIGKIPEHWEVKRLKDIARIINGYAFNSNEYIENGIPIIRIGDIADSINIINTRSVASDYIKIAKDCIIKNGDILLAMTGATIGKSAIYFSETKCLLNQRVCSIRVNKKVNPKLIKYIISSQIFLNYIDLICDGSAQENISKVQMENFPVQVTFDEEEQKNIAEYLDTKTAKIDQILSNIKTQMDTLKELRKTLINDVVTGKVRVSLAIEENVIN